eukprot:5586543-Karenia_brevis.AAC.1
MESMDDWQLALGIDHFSALGFQMQHDELGPFEVSPMRKFLVDLKPEQQKFLAGNGMHLVTMAASFLFMLSNSAKIE